MRKFAAIGGGPLPAQQVLAPLQLLVGQYFDLHGGASWFFMQSCRLVFKFSWGEFFVPQDTFCANAPPGAAKEKAAASSTRAKPNLQIRDTTRMEAA